MSGRIILATIAVLTFALISVGYAPAPIARGGADGLPVGKWTVEFANKVVEECEIRQDGSAKVAEPKRTSEGKAVAKDGAVVIVFDDDRVERWTPVGQRFVVEHWCPAAQYPAGTPVLGIADRSR